MVAPAVGLRRFTLTRHAPSASVGRLVDRYWVVEWDLDEPFTQQVLAHPAVNLSSDGHTSRVVGVQTKVGSRVLEGSGRVLGILFRPGGFRPLLGRSLTSITDATLPLADVLGGEATAELERAVREAGDPAALGEVADEVLARFVPDERHPCEDAIDIARRIEGDRTLTSVEAVAEATGTSPRGLQRMFREHVGLSPKRVIRRYRLYDAAERVARGGDVSWADVAAKLGYSDQAHLSRDFAAAFGDSPARYAKRNQAALTAPRT